MSQDIIQLGVRYPGTNVAPHRPRAGPPFPELHLDHVSLDEARAIAASLSGLDRKTVTVGNYPLPFHMRALGTDGGVDTSGYLGGEPRRNPFLRARPTLAGLWQAFPASE